MAIIYRYSHPFNNHGYVGKTEQALEERDKQRFRPSATKDSKSLKRAMAKYGKENFTVTILQDGIMHPEILNIRERYWIRHFDDYHNGYNETEGGDGFTSETSQAIQLKRVEEGTHPFQDSDFRKYQKEIAQATQRKRVEEGTHHFVGDSNPSRRRVAEGTHHFQGSEFQRASQEKQRKRVAEGTHNFQDSEFQRATAQKRVTEGTHNFLEKSFYSRRSYNQRINRKAKRREFYRIYAALLTAKSVHDERIYHKRTREGYFDVSIPDTSKSEQLDLF